MSRILLLISNSTYIIILHNSRALIIIRKKAREVNTNSADDILVAVGSGLLFLLFVIIVAVYLVVFFLLLCFTKSVSEPQDSYNSIFMFISGYSIIFILLYFMILFPLLVLEINDKFEGNEFIASFYVIWEFIIFFYFLKLAGVSIMFMLHHRKVNGIIFWCAIGCYYGDLILFLIALLAKKLAILEYPSFLFDIASIGLGSFFYFRYSNQNVSKGDIIAEPLYQQA